MQYVLKDAEANVLCPATKLWNTGHGANMLREAVSLMGGYGITEDCPGFLANKWMDAQLEATYEGPEAVQRRQLTVTMTSEVFLAAVPRLDARDAQDRLDRPGTGACTLASAMNLWAWTLNHLQKSTDPAGTKLYHGQRQGVTFALADALSWLMASRCQILDVLELETRGAADAVAAEGLEAPCSSSATCATRRPRRRRAKFRASAPSWSSATTGIRRGTTKSIATASSRANSKSWKRPCPASWPWPWTCSRPTAAIRKRPAPARAAPDRASSSACRAN